MEDTCSFCCIIDQDLTFDMTLPCENSEHSIKAKKCNYNCMTDQVPRCPCYHFHSRMLDTLGSQNENQGKQENFLVGRNVNQDLILSTTKRINMIFTSLILCSWSLTLTRSSLFLDQLRSCGGPSVCSQRTQMPWCWSR